MLFKPILIQSGLDLDVIGKKYNKSVNGNVYVYSYVILYFNKRDSNFQYVTLFADSFQTFKITHSSPIQVGT